MKLVIRPAALEDVYRDIVRVPETFRLDKNKGVIPEGSVCKVCSPVSSSYAIARGLGNSPQPVIQMDERLRNILRVSVDQEVEIRLKVVGLWGQFAWAWIASDPAYRVAARLGLLSLILGVFGLVLGLISLKGCS